MKIVVYGYMSYRDFYFPAKMFRPHVSFKFARMFVEGSYFTKDLAPHAKQLGAGILALGGIKEVVFRSGKIQVWTYENDDFTQDIISQIEDLIRKHYGPQAEKVVYLPFGYKLICPPK